jgi:hypothetical protein
MLQALNLTLVWLPSVNGTSAKVMSLETWKVSHVNGLAFISHGAMGEG